MPDPQVVKPDINSAEGKKEQVEKMFDHIAPKYDFLNHFLSFGIDKRWRKKTIARILEIEKNMPIMDLATGTGDLAITAAKKGYSNITGVDLSSQMLEIGKQKVLKAGFDKTIKMFQGDSENLKFSDKTFSAITIAFGVRNFENLKKGLSEMYRVLNNNGKVVILEFSMPSNALIRGFYRFYFKGLLPFIGRLVSKDKTAYTYLPDSVEAFPSGEDFLTIMKSVGYEDLKIKRLSFGIASIYCGYRRS